MKNQLDKHMEIHPEFLLVKHGLGVRAVRPNSAKRVANAGSNLNELLSLPFHTYFMNTESGSHYLNDYTLAAFGWESNTKIRDKTVVDLWGKSEETLHVLEHDKEVIVNQQIKIYEENVIWDNGESYPSLSVKLPWYSENNKVMGLLGISLTLGKPDSTPLARFLTTITQLGLLNNNIKKSLPTTVNGINLSRREHEILEHIANGYTAKVTGARLGISYRTVERYLEMLRLKFSAHSRSELLDKFYKTNDKK